MPTVVLAMVTVAATACSTGSGSTDAEAQGEQVDQSVQAMLPADIRDAGVLRIGTPLQNPPVIFKEGATVKGLGVDMVTAVADVMGLHVQYVETSLAGLLPGLSADRFDAIGGIVLQDTVEREQAIDIVSLAVNRGGVLVRKGNPAGIDTVEDLCGHVVGTLQGSAQEEMLRAKDQQCVSAQKSSVQIKLYPDAPAVLAQLQAGRLEAFSAPLTYATYMAKTVQDGNAIELAKGTYANGVYGIGVPKGQTQLGKAVQVAIKKIIETGKYQEILKKWDVANTALPADEILINGVGRGAFDKYGG